MCHRTKYCDFPLTKRRSAGCTQISAENEDDDTSQAFSFSCVNAVLVCETVLETVELRTGTTSRIVKILVW